MSTKRLLLLLIMFLIPPVLFSQTVTEKQAKTIAKNFFYKKVNIDKSVKYEDIELRIKQTYTKNNIVVFRVFEPLGIPGFVIVSAHESIIPVLGYSISNLYETGSELPPNFKEWVDSYAKQIESSIKSSVETKNSLWKIYSVKPEFKNVRTSKDVEPLLTTTWNQGSGYNNFCPIDNGSRVWAGCVATAMAQVMNYYEHPNSGEGSHSYVHSVYGEQFADFESAVYDWSIMPDNNGNNEISELIYHCGVSVNMNYSPSGSGAYSSNVVTAWKNYFKYSGNLILTSKYNYTDENWANMLIAEIDAGRPLYYHGYGSGGHAFNIDGYQGTDFFHLNWGWGGSYNGYFYINDLTPGGMNFTNSQGAIIGAQDRDLYPGLDCSGLIVLTANVPYNGTTTSSQNIVNKYGSAYYHSTGKEVIHQITTSFPGRIRASISGLGEDDLDVFILSHCNQDSLLAFGDTTAVADQTEAGTYYIVTDGRYANEGNYTLSVTVPSVDPDLIVKEQTVEPNTIEAGGTGFISFKVQNIGNNSAGASKTNIYYSEDAVFDGSDVFIEQINLPAINVGEEHLISQSIIIPAGATEGSRNILFVVDAENDVSESDEIYNTGSAWFNVPAFGVMDCSSSVSLSSDIWHFGNTNTDGQSNIDTYSCAWMYTEKEVIHSITATYSGLATIEFTEKVPGRLNVLALTSCNENTCTMSLGIWMPEDTLTHESMQVIAGVTYYFVVDGEAGVSGDYGLKIKMPGACPSPYISHWGEIDVCESEYAGASLFTDWGYEDIQWYKDNIAIEGQIWSNLWASETGEYKVEVIENGCSAFSETIPVRISPVPSHADISSSGDTMFCEGNSVLLNLNTGPEYTIQWMKNGNAVEGENGLSLLAEESGIYTAEVTNIACSFSSNTKQVTSNPVTADIGEFARVNASTLVSHFSCDINDNTDLSGNGNDYSGSWDFPEDRHGNWAKAQYYNGQWDNGSTTNTFDNPNIFTLSIWIKTNTNTGGMIFGLGDSQWGGSVNVDRMIYMDDAGKLYFGLMDGTAKTVSTSESYNDNNWHLVNASLSASGMKLYVDGQLADEDAAVTNGADYIGWWRIAYDEIDATFPNKPTSLYYQGSVDDIKVYERSLSEGEISYLYEENLIFDASLNETEFCEPASSHILLSNTEAFVDYQLRDDADNSFIGSAVTGNTGTINLSTGVISETTTYNILATNTITACSFELNNIFTITIGDFSAPIPDESILPELTAECEISTLTVPSATDNCTGAVNGTHNAVLPIVSQGTTIVSWTYNDGNGNTSTQTQNVILSDISDPTISCPDNQTVYADDTHSYSVSGNEFDPIATDDNCNIASVVNNYNNTASLEGTILPEGISHIIWTVTDDAGNNESCDFEVLVNNYVGVGAISENSFAVYPNPTDGILTVESVGNFNVSLTDINGRIIYSSFSATDKTFIDMLNYGSGIYFLKLSQGEHVYYRKVIVR